MMQNPSAMQQRIIRVFVRKNVQGWGKPLAFATQRVQLGGLFALAVLALIVISSVVGGGVNAILSPHSGFGVFLTFLIILLATLWLGAWWTSLIPYLRATQQPSEQVSGTVAAAICNPQEIVPFVKNSYHFITLRQMDGQLRPFAIDPELHDQVCQVGRKLTLTVIPGIE